MPEAGTSATTEAVNGPRVLVVDDDGNDVTLLRRAFRQANLPPPHVENDGEQAIAYLEVLADNPAIEFLVPTLILLDLKMPRRDGFDVLRWLRAADRPVALRRVPVVVFTSSNQEPDVARAYDLGANSFLVKPVAFQDLRELVESVREYWLGRNLPPPSLIGDMR